MDEKRLRGLLGLCIRAGKAVFGEEGCRKALAGTDHGILLVDAGASDNTRKRYAEFCERAGRRMALLPEGLLSAATGRTAVAMYVKESSFSEQVIGCLNPDNRQ